MIIYISSCDEFPKNLLGHILKYYTQMGIDRFAFSVYGGETSPAWEELMDASLNYPIKLSENPRQWSTNNDSDFKNWVRKQLSPNDWIVPADLDEFHYHPQFSDFRSLGEAMAKENAEYVETSLVDRVTVNGSIPLYVLPEIPLEKQFPVTKSISADVMKCYVRKTIMLRPHLEIYPGHHFMEYHQQYKKFSPNALTNHFKWHGDLRMAALKKKEMYESAELPWFEEQDRLLEYLEENGGKV